MDESAQGGSDGYWPHSRSLAPENQAYSLGTVSNYSTWMLHTLLAFAFGSGSSGSSSCASCEPFNARKLGLTPRDEHRILYLDLICRKSLGISRSDDWDEEGLIVGNWDMS